MSKLKNFLTTAKNGIIGNAAYFVVVTILGSLAAAGVWLANRSRDPAWAGVMLGGLFLVTVWVGLVVILRRLRTRELPDLPDLISESQYSGTVWGYVRNLMIQADVTDPSSVTCMAYVRFIGLRDGDEAQPTELLLVVPGNDEEIAKLTLSGVSHDAMANSETPVMVATYRCPAKDVSVKVLQKAVLAAMSRQPSAPPAFAWVGVREPNGAAMRAYKESRVRVSMGELFVRIEGWPPRTSSAATSPSASPSAST